MTDSEHKIITLSVAGDLGTRETTFFSRRRLHCCHGQKVSKSKC